MNGYSWTARIGQGGLGFPGLSGCVGYRHLDIRSGHRGPAAGGLAVDRHADGPVHGRGGVPVHMGDGFDLDLVRRRRSAKIKIAYDAAHGMKSVLMAIALGLAILALTACVGMPPDGAPTATPAPPPAGWGTPEPASGFHRLDLGSGVVVAFVEGLTPEMSEKLAYVTHVPSGSQAILDGDGEMVHRHDGRSDGPDRLDAILNDGHAMARILEGLTNGEDARPKGHTISWVPMVKFDGIHYVRRWYLVGKFTRADIDDLTTEHLGPELFRVAFRGDGYAGSGYRHQDGDATFLNPGTPVYTVKGYSPKFRLATLEQGRPTLYEADTNPLARTGEDLLDIRGKVTAIDILNDDDENTLLATIDDGPTIARFVDKVLEAAGQSKRPRPARTALFSPLPPGRRNLGGQGVPAGDGRDLPRHHDGCRGGIHRGRCAANQSGAGGPADGCGGEGRGFGPGQDRRSDR